MRFASFKAFRPLSRGLEKSRVDEIVGYLTLDLMIGMNQLVTGLNKISFEHNFESFRKDISISAQSEIQIKNELDSIPSGYIFLRKNEYALSVCDGDTAWGLDYIYLKNTHVSGVATGLVLFFK